MTEPFIRVGSRLIRPSAVLAIAWERCEVRIYINGGSFGVSDDPKNLDVFAAKLGIPIEDHKGP